jgi:hypothetical protein
MAKKDELGEDYVELVSLMIQEREEYRPDFQTLAQLVEGKKSAEEQERILRSTVLIDQGLLQLLSQAERPLGRKVKLNLGEAMQNSDILRKRQASKKQSK